MRPRWLWLFALLPACGGGSSGGGPDDGGPPPIPFATTTNTGLAVAGSLADVTVVGDTIVVPVAEIEMGTDRNADGDTLDDVVACVDTTTGDVFDLGLAVIGPILSTATTCAFLVSEDGQGRTDLNGDGDANDTVWFVFDPSRARDSSNPVNTGVAAPPFGAPAVAAEGGYVFLRSEFAENQDLNGDGDMIDSVTAVYKESVRAVVPTPPATYATGTPLVSRGGRVLVAASELFAGADLNRDGDAFDNVLVYIDLTGLTVLVRPVGGVFPRAVGQNAYQLTNDAAVYLIDEAGEGNTDLNGDGDTADAIIAVFDIAGGTGEYLPTSSQFPTIALAADRLRGIGASMHRAVFAISEPRQNATDFNGDLDAFDAVVAWIDTQRFPGAVHVQPFALSALPILVDGERALIGISEQADGAIVGKDHNGDGDINDDVAYMLDMPAPRGGMYSLGFAVRTLTLNGSEALIGVPENGHFSGDINGNGIVGDIVTFYVDFSDTPPTTSGLGLVANATSVYRVSTAEVRLAAMIPEGQSSNFNDLNGDGDKKDNAIVLLGIDPSGSAPFLLPPTPFFAGTAGFIVSAPVRVGNNAFAFATAEDMVRQDLNGDGDTLDTVLQYVRYE